MSHYKCKECGNEVYTEALVDADEVVIVSYGSAICNNRDGECRNSYELSKDWERIATLEPNEWSFNEESK